jgi:hypothetical protein
MAGNLHLRARRYRESSALARGPKKVWREKSFVRKRAKSRFNSASVANLPRFAAPRSPLVGWLGLFWQMASLSLGLVRFHNSLALVGLVRSDKTTASGHESLVIRKPRQQQQTQQVPSFRVSAKGGSPMLCPCKSL